MGYTNNPNRGKFHPINPRKYRGDVANIIWRSLWELNFCKWADRHPNVLQWSSEEIIVHYISPVDHKSHRYFLDFWVKLQDKDGKIQEFIFEIKPARFTQAPKTPKRKTKVFLKEVQAWFVNTAKWEAALKVANERGWKFRILTEHDLGKLAAKV